MGLEGVAPGWGPSSHLGLDNKAEKTTHACCRTGMRLCPLPGTRMGCGQVCGRVCQVTWLWQLSPDTSARASHMCDPSKVGKILIPNLQTKKQRPGDLK